MTTEIRNLPKALEENGRVYATIIDSNTKTILNSGQVVRNKKTPVECVSFNEVIFFKASGTPKYMVKFTAYPIDSIKGDFVPDHFVSSPWRAASPGDGVDCYIENDFIDGEVANLVISLNKIKGIVTRGSCSGHGLNPMFVSFHAYNFQALNTVVRAVEYFKEHFTVTTHFTGTFNTNEDHIAMMITSNAARDPNLHSKANSLASTLLEIAIGLEPK